MRYMFVSFLSSEVRIEGLETLDYLDSLNSKNRVTEQGDAITFESEVSLTIKGLLCHFFLFALYPSGKSIPFVFFIFKVDRIYVSTPTKIAILDHEKKRTFVLRKEGLPDAGKLQFCYFYFLFLMDIF